MGALLGASEMDYINFKSGGNRIEGAEDGVDHMQFQKNQPQHQVCLASIAVARNSSSMLTK